MAAAALVNFNLPSQIASTADVLNLPVYNSSPGIYGGIGIGDYQTPGPYNHGQFDHNNRPRFYVQDTWKLRPTLTLNYGLAYEADLGLFNSSLNKPAYLSLILGSTHPTDPNLLDFSPAFGFAWSLGKSGKTVIRGGGGIYWDSINLYYHWREEAAIGPLGDMRQIVVQTHLQTSFPGFSISMAILTAPPCPSARRFPSSI